MKFHYTAINASGKVVDGSMDAQTTGEVLAALAGRGLRPSTIKSLGNIEVRGPKQIFVQAITLEDKVFISKYIALMLRAGIDLLKAIDTLYADFNKQSVKALLAEVKDSLANGRPFYSVFAKYPKYFSPVFVNMIRAGEASGNLDKVFEDLSTSLEKENNLHKKIMGAIIYPAILLGMSFVILLGLVSFALPKIAEVFTTTTGTKEIPLFSKIVFSVGAFFGRNAYIIIPLLFISIGVAWWFFSKTVPGHKYMERILRKTPFVKDVVLRIAVQRFASTLASLLKSGMPIITSLEITAESVGFPELRAAILRISREGLAKGLTMSESFQRETFFPRVVVNLISVSEKSGHIDSILETLSEFYETEIESAIKTMLSLIEPILLTSIGIIVAVIALAIIVPIYQLVGNI